MRDKLLKREKFQKKFDPRQNFEGSSENLSLALLNLKVDPIFFGRCYSISTLHKLELGRVPPRVGLLWAKS